MSKLIIRKIIVYGSFIFLITILQYSLYDFIVIGDVRPAYFIVFPMIVGYIYGTNDAIITGIISGFLMDSFSGRYIGLGIIICIYCGIFTSYFLKRHLGKNIFIAALQVFAGTLIYVPVIFLFYYIFNGISYDIITYTGWVISERLIPQIILNTFVSLIIYLLIRVIPPYSRKKGIFEEKIKSKGFSGEFI